MSKRSNRAKTAQIGGKLRVEPMAKAKQKQQASRGSATLSEYKQSFGRALDLEIAAIEEEGGTKYSLAQAKYVATVGAYYFYSFTADEEVRIPDDTPVLLEFDGQRIEGTFSGAEGFTVWVVLSERLPEQVTECTLTANATFLLKALREALPLSFEYPGLAKSLFCPRESLSSAPIKSTDKALEAATSQPITLVWGPPGTGKTHFIGQLSQKVLESDMRMLVLSISNIAVDTATLEANAQAAGAPPGRIVRFGYSYHLALRENHHLVAHLIAASLNPRLAQERAELQVIRRALLNKLSQRKTRYEQELQRVERELFAIRCRLHEEELRIASEAQCLFTTLAKSTITGFVQPAWVPGSQKAYDLVVVDEASMISLPYLFWAASLARKHIVIVGDFRQLPPICISKSTEATRYLSKDVFEELGIIEAVNEGRWDSRLVVLHQQYRMHTDISGLVKDRVYGGYMENAPEVQIRPHKAIPPLPSNACLVFDTEGKGDWTVIDPTRRSRSRFNIFHAVLCVELAGMILESNPKTSIGIIAPYVMQSRIIQRMLRELGLGDRVSASTIHRFQGSERDVIIFDTVDSPGVERIGRFLREDCDSGATRLVNVAVTRARDKLILVAHKEWLCSRLPTDNLLGSILSKLPVATTSDLLPPMLKGLDFWRYVIWLDELTIALDQAQESVAAWAQDSIDDSDIIVKFRHALGQKQNTGGQFTFHLGISREFPRELATRFRNLGAKVVQVPFVRRSLVVIDKSKLFFKPKSFRSNKTSSYARHGWVQSASKEKLPPSIVIDLPETVALISSMLRLTYWSTPVAGTGLSSHLDEYLKYCPRCGKPMKIRRGPHGYFKACSGYPRCKFTASISVELVEDYLEYLEAIGKPLRCEKCGALMAGRSGRNGVFLGCSSFPVCNFKQSLEAIM